jgi:hypothetical protein
LVFTTESEQDGALGTSGSLYPLHVLPDEELGQPLEGDFPPTRRTAPEMLLKLCGYFITQRSINCFSGMIPDHLTIHSATSENVEQQNLRFPPFQH